jgi:hypothetical protein
VPTSGTTGRACVPEPKIPAATDDVDTFLVTVYCLIDDLYRQHAGPVRAHLPGRPGELSDSEVLTLAVLAQWQPSGSERQFITWAAKHWRGYFPRLLSQSAFNRRARQLYGVLARLSEWIRTAIEAELSTQTAYEIMDGVPVPLMRRCRGRRHRSFGSEADFGHGGSDQELYYGVKLVAAVDVAGFVTGWVVGPASTEEHWLAEALFSWRQQPTAPAPSADRLEQVLGPSHRHGGRRYGPNGPVRGRLSAGQPSDRPMLADLGFRGSTWRHHWRADWGASVLLKTDFAEGPDRPRAVRWFNSLRHAIETTFSCLESQLRLKFPRARTHWGLLTRLAAKISAYNLALAFNYLVGRPTYAFANPLG